MVSSYFLHPRYDKKVNSFDVAILKTTTPFPINSFAKLPIVNLPLPMGVRVETVGWGKTETGMLAERLMKVNIPVVSAMKCKMIWQQYYSETSLCAGRTNKDSCAGDSGQIFNLSHFCATVLL